MSSAFVCNLNLFPSTFLELCHGQENLIKGFKKSKQDTALSLNALFHFMKFQQKPLNSFGVMLPDTKV